MSHTFQQFPDLVKGRESASATDSRAGSGLRRGKLANGYTVAGSWASAASRWARRSRTTRLWPDASLLPHQTKRLARRAAKAPVNVSMLPNDGINSVFEAAVQATETMTSALPHDRLREVLKKYGRLTQ